VDYLESIRDDAITSLTSSQIIAMEADFPDRVQREAPGDGFPAGRITYLDYRTINLRQVVARSIDFALDQQLSDIGGGTLRLSARASKNIARKTQNTNDGPLVETVHDFSNQSVILLFVLTGSS